MKFFSLKDILHNTTQKGYQKSEKKKKKKKSAQQIIININNKI